MTYQWRISDLNLVKGSEQSGNRPVLVISTEEANQAIPVVTILSITSFKTGRKIYPVEVLLPKQVSGLPQDSIVMAHQMKAISNERLGQQIGYIHSEDVRFNIHQAIKLYLDME